MILDKLVEDWILSGCQFRNDAHFLAKCAHLSWHLVQISQIPSYSRLHQVGVRIYFSKGMNSSKIVPLTTFYSDALYSSLSTSLKICPLSMSREHVLIKMI